MSEKILIKGTFKFIQKRRIHLILGHTARTIPFFHQMNKKHFLHGPAYYRGVCFCEEKRRYGFNSLGNAVMAQVNFCDSFSN